MVIKNSLVHVFPNCTRNHTITFSNEIINTNFTTVVLVHEKTECLFAKQLPVPASVTSPTDPLPTLATLLRLSDPMLVLANDPSTLSLGTPAE